MAHRRAATVNSTPSMCDWPFDAYQSRHDPVPQLACSCQVRWPFRCISLHATFSCKCRLHRPRVRFVTFAARLAWWPRGNGILYVISNLSPHFVGNTVDKLLALVVNA